MKPVIKKTSKSKWLLTVGLAAVVGMVLAGPASAQIAKTRGPGLMPIHLSGTVQKGVVPGCLVLQSGKNFVVTLVAEGDIRKELVVGKQVRIFGVYARKSVSSCNQGPSFIVRKVTEIQKPGSQPPVTPKPTLAPKPSPTNPPTAPPQPSAHLTGTVVKGVESGCFLLKPKTGNSALLIGKDVSKYVGTEVMVLGTYKPELVTTCQQGLPFVVSSISPVLTKKSL